jgi:membrane protease YdiL (CAAX protease family)
MKISENPDSLPERSPEHGPELDEDHALAPKPSPVAPWWHTCLLILLFAAVSFAGALRSKNMSLAHHHLPQYLSTLAFEWIIAGIAWWGLRLRRTPIAKIVGERRRGFIGWRDDILAAAIFWIMALIVLAAIGSLLRLTHLATAQKAIASLAPQSFSEIVLWIVLSISAGICEEFIFRGYMLQQFTSLTGRLWPAVLISSLLFGVSHGYEGIGGIIAITAYGALFCVLAIKRNSLRPGMIAHAWHDVFSGIMLALVQHLHLM